MDNTLWIRLPVHDQRYLAEEYGTIGAEYTSTGKSLSGLEEAISHARETGSRLIIGRIGSLVRSHVVLSMLDGIEFICCDKPYLNNKTRHVALEKARFFARVVSKETKEKLVGKVMGFANPAVKKTRPSAQKKAIREAAKVRQIKAQKLYSLLPFDRLRKEGMTYSQIAEYLNAAGHRTAIGTLFNGPTVYRIMHRRRQHPYQWKRTEHGWGVRLDDGDLSADITRLAVKVWVAEQTGNVVETALLIARARTLMDAAIEIQRELKQQPKPKAGAKAGAKPKA